MNEDECRMNVIYLRLVYPRNGQGIALVKHCLCKSIFVVLTQYTKQASVPCLVQNT